MLLNFVKRTEVVSLSLFSHSNTVVSAGRDGKLVSWQFLGTSTQVPQ